MRGLAVPDAAASERIGLIRGPIHYDFLIKNSPDIAGSFGFARDAGVPIDHPGAEWVLVGWGARDFYTTVGTYRDLSLRALWRGAMGDDAVLRVDVLGVLPGDVPGLIWVDISREQLEALMTALEDEMTDASALDHPGHSQTDRFFAGQGPFHALRTCNVWVGEMLASANIPVGRWTPTPWSLERSLSWHGAIDRAR